MEIPFFRDQTNLLNSIALLRNARLDQFFLFLDYFDTLYFAMILIPIIWIGISDRWGLRVAILLIFSALLNYHLKHLFDFPRPIVASPHLPMLSFNDPGFPSGAAQTATLLSGLLIYAWKNPWAWVIAISYTTLICFSRLYLGVHYPFDILGGIAIGLALLFIYTTSIEYIEKFLKKQGRGFCVLISVLFCFLYEFFLPSPQGSRLIGAFLGFAVGAYASLLFSFYPTQPRPVWTRTSHVAVTIMGLFILLFLTPRYTPSLVQTLILSLWISLGAYPLCETVVGD